MVSKIDLPQTNAAVPSRGGVILVGIGASAGGLEAARRLVASIPAETSMAFILVQHLDPDHDSMMVDLLAGHTHLVVRQAAEGMAIEPEHLYVIPPGVYITAALGLLHVIKPLARQGARMPFDHLLQSMAQVHGPRAACIVLSGTGADGSIGLAAIKAAGGLVIVQAPADARFDGMPRSASQTGLADLVLPVAAIPAALLSHFRDGPDLKLPDARPPNQIDRRLPEILDLLRARSARDFAQYKEGTLVRRIERRIGLVQQGGGDVDAYLKLLAADSGEAETLVRDLLIHVTSFFRDRDVFALLAGEIVPELVRRQPADQPLRI